MLPVEVRQVTGGLSATCVPQGQLLYFIVFNMVEKMLKVLKYCSS
jgi:hypothetical protein